MAMDKDRAMTFYWLAIRTDYLCSITATNRDSDAAGLGPTSWETWSHRTACCIKIEDLLATPTPAGARWLLHSQPLVIREFGLSRSGRIDGDRRTHHDQVIDKAVLREALQDAFASQLPYCDITVSMGERKYQSVIADYEWVVGLNFEMRSNGASTLAYRRRSKLMFTRCIGRATVTIFPERHATSIMSYNIHVDSFEVLLYIGAVSFRIDPGKSIAPSSLVSSNTSRAVLMPRPNIIWEHVKLRVTLIQGQRANLTCQNRAEYNRRKRGIVDLILKIITVISGRTPCISKF